jgi:hypothetical protein
MADNKPGDGGFARVFKRMLDAYGEHQKLIVLRSYGLASREERDVRLRAIIELSVELERIKAVNPFGTRIAESVIQAIIEGDWKYAATLSEDITSFRDELWAAELVSLWTNFRAITVAACAAGRLRQEESPTSRSS